MKTSKTRCRELGRLVNVVVLVVLISTAASAQQLQVVLDPAQTRVEWTLGASMHTVHGSFKLKSGNIRIDPKTGDASGQIVVDATSAESGNRSRDNKMHKDVLESARYPEIVFSPRHVSGNVPTQGSANLQVTGVFSIHGSDHDITLSLPVQVEGARATATAKFDVPYQAWGMKNPSNLFLRVDNKVEIEVTSVATVTIGATAALPAGRP